MVRKCLHLRLVACITIDLLVSVALQNAAIEDLPAAVTVSCAPISWAKRGRDFWLSELSN
jgi:hypothetical protein